jgi:hypothetical protein
MPARLDDLWRDLHYTLRTWGRNPCFTAINLLVLALGIAANTAVFSVVSAILLRPLPGIADAGRLVSLFRIQNGNTFDNMGYPDYRVMRRDLLPRHSQDVFPRGSHISGGDGTAGGWAGPSGRDRILACVGTESIPVSG